MERGNRKYHRPLYQNIILTLSDGSVHVFTGKAFTVEGETRTIKDTKFTVPKPLPEGCAFESADVEK